MVKRGSSLNSDILLLDKRQDRQFLRRRRERENTDGGGGFEKTSGYSKSSGKMGDREQEMSNRGSRVREIRKN